MSDGIKIVKVDKVGKTTKEEPPTGGTHKRGHHYKTPKHGILKGGKTARNKPKIEAVRDPAKAPPMRKSTLKILTEKGAERRRKRIHKTVRSMPDAKVRHVLQQAGMPVSQKTPPELAKKILEGGMEAGMIVVK
jgi:hypothetical protein